MVQESGDKEEKIPKFILYPMRDHVPMEFVDYRDLRKQLKGSGLKVGRLWCLPRQKRLQGSTWSGRWAWIVFEEERCIGYMNMFIEDEEEDLSLKQTYYGPGPMKIYKFQNF